MAARKSVSGPFDPSRARLAKVTPACVKDQIPNSFSLSTNNTRHHLRPWAPVGPPGERSHSGGEPAPWGLPPKRALPGPRPPIACRRHRAVSAGCNGLPEDQLRFCRAHVGPQACRPASRLGVEIDGCRPVARINLSAADRIYVCGHSEPTTGSLSAALSCEPSYRLPYVIVAPVEFILSWRPCSRTTRMCTLIWTSALSLEYCRTRRYPQAKS